MIFRSAVRRVLALAIVVGATPQVASAADWYVDGNDPNCSSGTGGPNDPFCTITAAVIAASSGDTIHIAAGTYFENLVLDKSLTLIGTSGAATTIVDGSSLATTVTIASGVTVVLDGLTITNGSARYGGGLYLGTSSVVQLDGCV